ncbi:MAG: hypothetical protein DMD91_22605 [Candidatus Rokuibacteriota bacterium]|nr:MAG: hypothetical protein DMD91_22605 [Candidatus Rokubacteria bacterium]
MARGMLSPCSSVAEASSVSRASSPLPVFSVTVLGFAVNRNTLGHGGSSMDTGNKLSWFRRHPFASAALVFTAIAVGMLPTSAQAEKGQGGGGAAALAAPARTGGDIINNAAAIRLGKALFWDMQAGGDGQIACATCHFHAGADNRTFNTLHPGPDGIFASGGVTAAGQNFTPSNIVNDDRVGSQGIVGSIFVSIDANPNHAADNCNANETAPFFHNRRVTGRNTPSVVNAVFNRQNFWDGRANDNFNGNDPFGLTGNAGGAIGTTVTNSSLASQAVGPPNNPTEMSCEGRTFNGPNSLAAKMLARTPLRQQFAHPQDSVLGGITNWPNPGLSRSYTQLISDAYGPAVAANAANTFSRIWGESIQAYVSTLIPDRTPFDTGTMTASQQKGQSIFGGKGQCSKCHAGAELTDASVNFAASNGLVNEDGGDQGFHNTGVTPTAQDIGRAGTGPNGVSFSVSGNDRGAFKTPALRNDKLTAPYMHNGGKATLADVVDFYNRGGDVQNPELAKRIKPLGLSSSDKAALVDFLMNALTDCRTERDEAPFDHPSLAVPNGANVPATGGGHTCN